MGKTREITDHHDGHGLAESITIEADDLDPNGGMASHRYLVYMRSDPESEAAMVATIQFQQGPRNVAGSKAGVLDSVLLAIVIDRMRAFNAGPFSTRENSLVMTKCQEALHWLKHRADERAQRGVLGHNTK